MAAECTCGGKGGLHVLPCPIAEPTIEDLKRENAHLKEVLGRYIRAVDLAQRALIL